MYKEGDYVVYRRDLCKIKRVDDLYYNLSPLTDDSLSIKVLKDNKNNYLRLPISRDEADLLIKKIPEIEPLQLQDKLLENEYKNLLRTNEHEDLIKIIKTTYIRNEFRRKQGKKASDKDLIYFNMAEKLLYTELAYSLGIDYDACKSYILEVVSNGCREDE